MEGLERDRGGRAGLRNKGGEGSRTQQPGKCLQPESRLHASMIYGQCQRRKRDDIYAAGKGSGRGGPASGPTCWHLLLTPASTIFFFF